MLSGWELKYQCDDHHGREAGVWIDRWSYQKAPGATTGTLRYRLSSTLHDNDNFPAFVRHKVSVLGLKPLAGAIVIFKKGK